MVIMFSRYQTALLSIQLLIMCQDFAVSENPPEELLVSQGNSVILTCNTTMANVTNITWTKDRFIFAISTVQNRTFSNFTSQRLRIDKNLPSQMNISNIQHEDAGLYRCEVNGVKNDRISQWSIKVSREPRDIYLLWYFPYILTAAVGFLLCGIALAVCICRKHHTTTPNQNPVQDQFELQSVTEVTDTQPQGGRDIRTNKKRSSQYAERLNSIYGHF